MPVESTASRGSLPAIVIQQAITQQVATSTSTDVSYQTSSLSPSRPPSALRVEAETRQGYVYQGKLLSLDDDYNISLAEATSWRDRLCDVERALLAVRGFPAPAASPATRRRYVGSVFIRSSNLLMVRFLEYDEPGANGRRDNSHGAAGLRSAFKSMVSKVKRQINMERKRNRMERQKRLHLAQTPVPTKAANDGSGMRSRKDPKAGSNRRRAGRFSS
ncbi:hypothetical protein C3747_23g157 [Trypanosoma cruzi]|uniref:LSM domain-containing protein n=2 Tax=Trypanosoma cruzi TaxID=5693 RepID=Q4CY75_TRYCC|nr:hypothetical protein, conserved [Trypanosoma cruzi]EAN85224.1 hypothetical protein, conserved [Trypanosoma cruzi]PWV16489.1 hypothetical protein C3747_23g157 [Trypanosoma cruzi]RNC45156.1 hypothetical protein TcCL_NonESM05113 [Trypanosoma cruzi]|eukprot:XP_807075.1 hypothetical protein [Trypanosoma cruzi strain CL Brener]